MATTVSQTYHKRGEAVGMLAYAASIAVIATVGWLVAVVAAKPLFPSGEAWSFAGVFWAFSVPAIIVLSALSCFVYRVYRRATTAVATSVIFLGNLVCVALGGPTITYLVISVAAGHR